MIDNREAFEAWAISIGMGQLKRDRHDIYTNDVVYGAWIGYQAALAQVNGNEQSQAQQKKHILYKDGDKDMPEQICDGHGQVALAMCKVCRKAECELDESPYCVSQAQQPANEEKALYWFNCLSKVAALLEIPNDQPITSAPEVLENLLQSQSAYRKSSITFQQYEAFTMAAKQVAKERMSLPPAPEGDKP